jgi:hypothetical protein
MKRACRILGSAPAVLILAVVIFCVVAPANPSVRAEALAAGADDIEEIEEIEEVTPVEAGGFNVWTLVFALGIVNAALLLFQLGTGLRIIKVKFGVHRKAGILLAVCALIHGVLALFF